MIMLVGGMLCSALAVQFASGPYGEGEVEEVAGFGWTSFLPPAEKADGPYPDEAQCSVCPANGVGCCRPQSALVAGELPSRCPTGHQCCNDCGPGATLCACDLHPCVVHDKRRPAGEGFLTEVVTTAGVCCSICNDQRPKCKAATFNGTHCELFSAVNGSLLSAPDKTLTLVLVQGVRADEAPLNVLFVLAFPLAVVALPVMILLFCRGPLRRWRAGKGERAGELIGNKYVWKRALARGGFASVCEVMRNKDNAHLALKEIPVSSEEDARYAREEGLLVDFFQGHPYMVEVSDRFFWDGKNRWETGTYDGRGDSRKYCIVMRLYPEGDLMDYLLHLRTSCGNQARVPEQVIQSVVEQVCQLLHSLHNSSVLGHEGPIVHRDLKPQNLLVAEKSQDKLRVVVTDFGLARLQEQTYLLTQAGSMPFMAPECWRRRYGREVDIWSLGCIAYVMATLRVRSTAEDPSENLRCLFAEANDKGFSEALFDEVVARGYTDELAQLITDCLQADPHNRPTAGELLGRLGASPIDWRPATPHPADETQQLV
eukprot:Hpha_TRINITY_DN10179_c0_g1::TRINITY_DN10179_c0_g1_i1::g.131489::m.131489/K20877/NEK8; NIMA (never in mitosis gene a)-related kinase 8